MLDRIAEIFADASESIHQTYLSCGTDIERAIPVLVEALVSDHRLLCCGNGGSAANAQQFVAKMLNRFERERPAFPAIAVVPDTITFSGIVGEGSFAEVYARPIRAIGQAGDVLVAISASGNASNVMLAIQAAHDRDMRVVALTGHDGGDITRVLREDDVEIRVPSERNGLIHQAHLCILHSICELIDEQLFGSDYV